MNYIFYNCLLREQAEYGQHIIHFVDSFLSSSLCLNLEQILFSYLLQIAVQQPELRCVQC